MSRLAMNAGLILAVAVPLAFCGEVDQVALLRQARAKIVENIRRLPKYTCLQTVHRSRFQYFPPVNVSGCGHVRISGTAKVQPKILLAWSDRFKLDVTVSNGVEIFSWAGAREFQTEEVQEIVGAGTSGTGDFGPFLMSIFGGDATAHDYVGSERIEGRDYAVYRYNVPVSASHYQMRVGPQPEEQAFMAYEGKFWIDPQNAELARMTIEVHNPPRASDTCRVETTIDYRRAQIGRSDFLLPRLTVLKLWAIGGERHENQIEYATCREFQSESVFRTDLDTTAAAPEARQSPVVIPPGATIRIALRSRIDADSSFAGDAIEGQLMNSIGKMVPKGAKVHGRIVRFVEEHQPSHSYTVGLKFNSIEVNGNEVPLMLRPVSRKKTILSNEIDERQGVGLFTFRTGRLALDQKFVSEWMTMGN